MIGEALITMMTGIVYAVLDVLPNLDNIPAAVTSATETVAPILGQLNSILPIDQAMIALSLLFAIEIAILGAKLLEWGLSKIFPTGQMKLPL